MKIVKRLQVPTGDILIVEGETGYLEMLSLGDYGKDVNLNQHKNVPDGLPLMPLTDKWVITVSTQYGCEMMCPYCDVPKVSPPSSVSHVGSHWVNNATRLDLFNQVLTGLELHTDVMHSKRLNIHFARMGEPTWNPNVLECAQDLYNAFNSRFHVHPVVSTMMPKNNTWLKTFIHYWVALKNGLYHGNAGLQLSINSTDEQERIRAFGNNACTLEQISEIMYGVVPHGRKITLNFAVANYTVDPKVLRTYFHPDHYICKLTPMHKTARAVERGIMTSGDYTTPEPYLALEKDLQNAGYETLTFIASNDEDLGRITCGNAILSGSLPHKYKTI